MQPCCIVDGTFCQTSIPKAQSEKIGYDRVQMRKGREMKPISVAKPA